MRAAIFECEKLIANVKDADHPIAHCKRSRFSLGNLVGSANGFVLAHRRVNPRHTFVGDASWQIVLAPGWAAPECVIRICYNWLQLV